MVEYTNFDMSEGYADRAAAAPAVERRGTPMEIDVTAPI
jgi:hypothetical protein